MFLRSIVESRVVTGVLGIGFLLWVGMGVFDAITSSLTTLSGERRPGRISGGNWWRLSCWRRPAFSSSPH